jgi:alkylation response protein AidB-like acyl-CoA dehydrogenase
VSVLGAIAAGADDRDRGVPAFPEEPLRLLEDAGALAATLPRDDGSRPSADEEWSLLRRVASADGSVARILDGHLNGVDRICALAPEPLRRAEIAAIAGRARRIGVWGADPGPGEGRPAELVDGYVEGVKVFCSGAGGVDRALVTVRTDGAVLLAYVDVTRATEVDRGWFRGSGLRTSESHRVLFHGAPVVDVLGGPGELGRDPAFSLDAMRTTACWVGMGEGAAETALSLLAQRDADLFAALAAGRIMGARSTMRAVIGEEARRVGEGELDDLRARSVHLRTAVADACRTILSEAARAAGSRALAAGPALDRCRRDLDLFLLQHRLDPMVAEVGRREIEARR